MRRKPLAWILALLLLVLFSWPSGTSAHGDEDHDHPSGGCATTR